MSEVKKCPKCGGILASGYIIPPHGIRWTERKRERYVGDAEKLVSGITWVFQALPNIPAVRCRQCRIVIFSY